MVYALTALVAYLVWSNYQLEKRWRASRYAWHCMSDLSAALAQDIDDGGVSFEHWSSTVKEHRSFLARFKVPAPLNARDLAAYETALLDRHIEPLTKSQLL